MPFVQDTLRSLVGRIDVKTNAGTITVDDPFGPGGGAPSIANRLLKPEFDIYGAGAQPGDSPIFASSPYGSPTMDLGPVLVFGGSALVAWFLYRALFR